MKIINPERENQTGSTASSSNANFPLANLFDKHPRNVWKANVANEATLRVKIDAGNNAIALFNTNADDVICTITRDSLEQNLDNAAAVDKSGGKVGIPCTGHGYSTDDQVFLNGTTNYDGVETVDSSSSANEIVIVATYAAETFAGTETVCIIQATETFDLRLIDNYSRFFADDPLIYRRFWMDYAYLNYAATATIKLTPESGETVYGGTLKAGQIYEFNNPSYQLREGRKDYSIRKELNNGAFYTRKRNIVRTFSGKLLVTRDVEFYQFIDIYDQFGPDPAAFLICDDIDDLEWSVYAVMETPLTGDHSYPTNSVIRFQLLEVV